MSWQDRLRQSAYTSPSGVRLVFDYEDVSFEIDKKTTAFNFSGKDGTYIQDLGHSGRRYPLRLIFHGGDCDIKANDFEKILLERGVGKLEHPIYGSVNVVPFGTISRRDDLVSRANQAIIEVTFFETLETVYPTSQANPSALASSSLNHFYEDASFSFSKNISLGSQIERLVFTNQYRDILNRSYNALIPIARSDSLISDDFDNIYNSLSNGLSVTTQTPNILAAQTFLFFASAVKAPSIVSKTLNILGGLFNNILQETYIKTDINRNKSTQNTFIASNLFAEAMLSGMLSSVINTKFDTKKQALESGEYISKSFSLFIQWKDNQIRNLELLDIGEAYNALQRSIALTVGFLIEISFTLKQERTIYLTRNRTIIDLCAELYGNIDTALDDIIRHNNLTGNEILELQAGKEIVYYI